MRLSISRKYSVDELEELFHSVGWELDTPSDVLQSAMLHSSNVVSAYDDNNKLIGIIRSMDDGCWHANIDCLVVHKDFQNTGVGTKLVKEMLEVLHNVPTISVSPNESKNFSFYERFGFKHVEDGGLLQLHR